MCSAGDIPLVRAEIMASQTRADATTNTELAQALALDDDTPEELAARVEEAKAELAEIKAEMNARRQQAATRRALNQAGRSLQNR